MRPLVAICFARIALPLACLGCHRSTPSGLAGTYVGWMFIDGKARPQDGSMGTVRKLVLNADGTFTHHEESKVMVDYRLDGKGTYVQQGDQVIFTGSASIYMDDGYRKGTTNREETMAFRLVDGMLEEEDSKGDPYYFRKEGSGPPPLPKELTLKASDSAAVALIRAVETKYASLKSYSDIGTLTSQGKGFVARDVRFKTRFKRPSKLLFQAQILEGGKSVDQVEVSFNGKATRWYQPEYGVTTDRPLGNALSIVAVNFGDEAELVPELLLPKEMNAIGIDTQYPEIRLLADETIHGKRCRVLQLKGKGANVTKLWIDAETSLILHEYEGIREATVDYTPEANSALSAKDFVPVH